MPRNALTIRQRRKQRYLQRDLEKLIKKNRQHALLTAKDAKKPLPAYTGIGRDYVAAGGGSSSGGVAGAYTTTDGIFTFVIK